MKIAVTGKGGAGKTTISCGLAFKFRDNKKQVVAVDCDPDTNFALALGFPNPALIKPVSQLKELIAERTGVESLDKPQTFFKLNPKVDDIPDKYALNYDGIKLLVMGKVCKAGSGCLCPENTFIKRLISHLVLEKNQVVILDMVAGTEHIGRGTAANVDVALIVVEPTKLGVLTGLNAENLLKQSGIKKISFIGNKIVDADDEIFLKENIKSDFLGFIHLNKTLKEFRGVFKFDKSLDKEFEHIFKNLTGGVDERG